MLIVIVQAVILLNKQETLNLVPRAHVKKLGAVAYDCQSRTGRWRQEGF